MPKVLDIIEVIDTTYQEIFLTILPTQQNKKKESNLRKLKEKTSQENLVKFTRDKTLHKFKHITLSLKPSGKSSGSI